MLQAATYGTQLNLNLQFHQFLNHFQEARHRFLIKIASPITPPPTSFCGGSVSQPTLMIFYRTHLRIDIASCGAGDTLTSLMCWRHPLISTVIETSAGALNVTAKRKNDTTHQCTLRATHLRVDSQARGR